MPGLTRPEAEAIIRLAHTYADSVRDVEALIHDPEATGSADGEDLLLKEAVSESYQAKQALWDYVNVLVILAPLAR